LITDREQHISLNERENDALISDAGRKRSLLVASKASITNRALLPSSITDREHTLICDCRRSLIASKR